MQSEYNKNVKKYPFIKKVYTEKNKQIFQETNTLYSSTGRNLYLDAFINTSTERFPAVVFIHGGGWKSGSKEMQNPLAEKIALSGFQTFTIEYRLSDEAK